MNRAWKKGSSIKKKNLVKPCISLKECQERISVVSMSSWLEAKVIVLAFLSYE